MFWILLLIMAGVSIYWYFIRFTQTGRMITKGILIYLSAAGSLFLAAALIVNIVVLAGEIQESSVAERKKDVEYSYYNGDYGQMRSWLYLEDCYEPEFDRYWEIAEAQQTCNEYYIYEMAAERNSEEKAKYVSLMEECREKLISMQKNSEFSENRELLAYYADSVK